MKHQHLAPAVYTPVPAYMADPRMRFARFAEGDTAGGTNPPEGGSGGGPQEQQPNPAGDQLGEGGVKALQSERDARKKAEADLKAANDRIKELEDAGKSDEAKRGERLAALEKSDTHKDATIAAKDLEILRFTVAAAKGLDLNAALRLRGSSREEIEADADDFARTFARASGVIPGAGARGTDSGPEPDPGLGRLRSAYEKNAKK